MPKWLSDLLPILVLLVVVSVVVRRLPRGDFGHSPDFLRRRTANWVSVGMGYAFLYFARYNITAFKNAAGMTHADYGDIDAIGQMVYGLGFLLNGPLTDRYGGRATMIAALAGAAVTNLALGWVVQDGWTSGNVQLFSLFYGANMYFQSFGAVSIVKVNAAWFHLRERGTFGGVFGILISLGVYFGYDWTRKICDYVKEAGGTAFPEVFWLPALAVGIMVPIVVALVRDTPGEAGHRDFDVGDAGSGDGGERRSPAQVLGMMLKNPVIVTLIAIEFCSGYVRQAIMKWYTVFAKGIGDTDGFVYANWGMLLCCAGILGGMFAGTLSDHLFQSRRGPMSAILYGGMLLGVAAMWLGITTPYVGWAAVFVSLCVIGVHGMLSGTASMDFGGKRNVGVVVGIIDGFVYLGGALQSQVLGAVNPDGDAQKDPANWASWPLAILPMVVLGLLLSTRVWNARADKGRGGH